MVSEVTPNCGINAGLRNTLFLNRVFNFSIQILSQRGVNSTINSVRQGREKSTQEKQCKCVNENAPFSQTIHMYDEERYVCFKNQATFRVTFCT